MNSGDGTSKGDADAELAETLAMLESELFQTNERGGGDGAELVQLVSIGEQEQRR